MLLMLAEVIAFSRDRPETRTQYTQTVSSLTDKSTHQHHSRLASLDTVHNDVRQDSEQY